MAHDDFDQKLSVGCICAGNLEGDIFAAKERERKLKSKNRRKKTFLKKEWYEKNKTWRLYFKNQWLRIETDSFCGKEYFKVYIDGECFQWKHSQRVTTLPAAKELIFDLMEDMK